MNKPFKYFCFTALTSALLICVTGCDDFFKSTSGLTRVALVTDVGDIDDRSFNQGTWEGLEDYLFPLGYKINKDFKYFTPINPSTADYLASIDDAITWGAEAVICPGFRFEPSIYEAQFKYPDVKFMIEDGTPHPINDFGKVEVADNTISLFFKEQESGFLAGYGAVYEGNKKLGFMGGMSVPAVKKFGAGFIAGVYYAAHELNLKDVNVSDDKFEYLGTFVSGADVKAKASSWYLDETDIIFTAAGGAGASVMIAAEENDKTMIGVDVDQAYMSKSVLTSAKKNLSKAVEIFLDRFFGGWQGGEILNIGVEEDGVSLPTEPSDGIDPWRFKNFTKEQYENIYERVKNKEFIVPATYKQLESFVSDLGYQLLVKENNFNDSK